MQFDDLIKEFTNANKPAGNLATPVNNAPNTNGATGATGAQQPNQQQQIDIEQIATQLQSLGIDPQIFKQFIDKNKKV